jgi:hypothetical protein
MAFDKTFLEEELKGLQNCSFKYIEMSLQNGAGSEKTQLYVAISRDEGDAPDFAKKWSRLSKSESSSS